MQRPGPIKIGIFEPYDWGVPGGVQRHVAAMDTAFRAMGHEVQIIAPCSSSPTDGVPPPPNLVSFGQSIYTVQSNGSAVRVAVSLRHLLEMEDFLVRERFDVIHLHEPLLPTLCLLALYHGHVVPSTVVVGTFHANRESHRGYRYSRPISRRLLNRLDGRIAVSEPARDTVACYMPGDYRIIPNGVDLAFFVGEETQPVERFREGRNILFVGRLEERKGFEHLLAAFGAVHTALPDVRLLVVGGYSDKDVQPFAEQMDPALAAHVHFIGRVPDGDLVRYYRTADVVCVPSTGMESFGLVLLEAMAAGRPVAAFNIPGYNQVVRDGVEGLLVPVRDEGALAAALVRLLNDPELCQRLGEAGKARAREFTWQPLAERVMDFYLELRAMR